MKNKLNENSNSQNENNIFKSSLKKEQVISNLVSKGKEIYKNIKNYDFAKNEISLSPSEICIYTNDLLNLKKITAEIIVQNISKQQINVYFKCFKCDFIKFKNNTNKILAPGMSSKLIMEFDSNNFLEINENVIVMTNNNSIELPVKIMEKNKLNISHTDKVDLGIINIKTITEFEIKFYNNENFIISIDSIRECGIDITSEQLPCMIKPKHKTNIKFKVMMINEKEINEQIVLMVNKNKILNFNLIAKFVINKYLIVDDLNKEIDEIDFGTNLFGVKIYKKIKILNYSDKDLEFEIENYKIENSNSVENKNHIKTPYELGLELKDQVIIIKESNGVIKPFDFKEILIEVFPKPNIYEKKIFQSVLKFENNSILDEEFLKYIRNIYTMIQIKIISIKETIDIKTHIACICPLINFSSIYFDFFDVEKSIVNSQSLKIYNYRPEYNCLIDFENTMQVYSDSNKIQLKNLKECEVKINIHSKNLGNINKKMKIMINNIFEVFVIIKATIVYRINDNNINTNPLISRGKSANNKLTEENRNSRSFKINKKSNLYNSDHFELSVTKKLTSEINKQINKKNTSIFLIKPINGVKPTKLKEALAVFSTNSCNLNNNNNRSLPSNHLESKQIQAKLLAEELMRININTTHVNFDKVPVNSVETKEVLIKNNLWTSIAVYINTNELYELELTSTDPIIIPGGNVGVIILKIKSQEVKSFNSNITYCINSHHFFKINIEALFIPVDIEVSKTLINFKIKEDSLDMFCEEIIQITNNGNHPANYSILLSKSSQFVIENNSDNIPKKSVRELKIKYIPREPKCEDIITLNIENGLSKTIKCIGSVNEVSYLINGLPLKFGETSSYQIKSLSFTIINSSKNILAFTCHDQLENKSLLKIYPSAGKIHGGNQQIVKVDIYSEENLDYISNIILKIRGLKSVEIPVTATFKIPVVLIEPSKFEFSNCVIGKYVNTKFSMKNLSNFYTDVYVDLTSQNSKILSLYNLLKINGVDENSQSVILIETIDKFKELILNKDNLKRYSKFEKDSLAEKSNNKQRFYKFQLKPNSSYFFNIDFTPELVDQYNFEIGFYFQKSYTSKFETRLIICKGVYPNITFKPDNGFIDFGSKIINTKDNSIKEWKTLTIINPSKTSIITWFIKQEVLENLKYFSFSNSSGIVYPNSSFELKLCFNPSEIGDFSYLIPLYLENEEELKFDIKIKGQTLKPSLLFFKEEYILTPVSLNYNITDIVIAENQGYNNCKFSINSNLENDKNGLCVEFEDSSVINKSNNILKIKLSFSSSEPIYYKTTIIISDQDLEQFSFNVICIADNSILTYGPFLELGDYMSIVLNSSNKLIDIDSAYNFKYNIEYDSYSNYRILTKKENPNFKNEDIKTYFTSLKKVINSWITENVTFEKIDILIDIPKSNGRKLFEILSLLFKNNAFEYKDEEFNSIDNLSQINKYDKIIQILKKKNPIIDIVLPKYLLNYHDYIDNLFTTYNDNKLITSIKYSEEDFQLISLINYVNLFLQIFKIIFSFKCELKDYKSSIFALMELKYKNDIIKSSNINLISSLQKKIESNELKDIPLPVLNIDKQTLYNRSEYILLYWTEACMNIFECSSEKVVNFTNNFNNLVYFNNLIDIYVEMPKIDNINIITNPESKDDYQNNINILSKKIIKLKLSQIVDIESITKNLFLSNILFLYNLFINLPNFIPKNVIDFETVLHEKYLKEIKLTNSLSVPVTYSLILIGNSDFSIKTNEIHVEPKSSDTFDITYQSNTSINKYCKLICISDTVNISGLSVLSYFIVTNSIRSHPLKIIEISNIPLYEVGKFEINIVNPFENEAVFQIDLLNTHYSKQSKIKNQSSKNKIKKELENKSNNLECENNNLINQIPVFFIKQDKIIIRKGGNSKLFVEYLPLKFVKTSITIRLLDIKVGEIQYELTGIPMYPLSTNIFDYVMEIETFNSLSVKVPIKNVQFEKALNNLIDRLKVIQNIDVINNLQKYLMKPETNFDVLIDDNEFLSIENSNLKIGKTNNDSNKNSKNEKNNDLEIILSSKKKSTVSNKIIDLFVIGKNLFNVKSIKCNLTIKPKPLKIFIEIQSNVRDNICQTIPVKNMNSFDCNYFLKIIEASPYFEISDGPFTIKKKLSYNLSLKFSSLIKGSYDFSFILFNYTTNESLEYFIKSENSDPLSEKIIKINTKQKTKTEYKISVINPIINSDDFYVSTDIPNCVFKNNVKIPFKQCDDFNISFTPFLNGEFIYKLIFKDSKGNFFWYSITVFVEQVNSINKINVCTEIRKPVMQKINIENSSNELIEYNVSINGEFISGSDQIQISGNSTKDYVFYYYPLKIEESVKKIFFQSKNTGDIYYEIECISTEAKPIKLNNFKTNLGNDSKQEIVLKNPLKNLPIKITVKSLLNNSNFKVSETSFNILQNSEYKFFITYRPKLISNNDSETLLCVSDKVGDWKFEINGVCLPPNQLTPVFITVDFQRIVTQKIEFKNPLEKSANYRITIKKNNNENNFNLIEPKSPLIVLNPFELKIIILKFEAREMKSYSSEIHINGIENLNWIIPIVANVRLINNNIKFLINTICNKERFEKLEFLLTDIINSDMDEDFEFSFTEFNNLTQLNKWLFIENIEQKTVGSSKKIKLKLRFLPLKPFKNSGFINVKSKSNGEWIFKLELEALNPDYFDQLVIYSTVNVCKTIQFRLFNSDKNTCDEFNAYFSKESDKEFDVFPKNGELESELYNGTIFQISYLPKQYGKIKTATLIVETNKFLWRIFITGKLDKYKPPL